MEGDISSGAFPQTPPPGAGAQQHHAKKTATIAAAMDAHQLVDSLTAHISLYNSSIPSSSALALPAAPRSSILRWFSSLSVPQRQSALTVVDSNFLRILLQMQSRLRHKGHGFFLLLPDLPSTSSMPSSLPSLIFRKSRGLLARSSAANEPEHVLSLSLRLFFSSDDDADAREFRSSPDELDACTVAEELVGDVERFVGVMDRVSGGMFLRGEERILGGDWFELGWLKAKGYYSLEAFVANKLEWAMRLSWMNSNGGKRRGGKAREEAGAAGVAANIFWRKKGCLDWWNGLETELKGKVLQTVLSKTAKSLAFETAKVPKDASNDGTRFFHVQAEQPIRYGSTMSYQETDADFESGFISTYLSGKRTSVASCFVRLMVLREISAVLTSSLHLKNGDKIFFSTLCSVNSVSDCVLRGVRRILGAISSDYVKLELFGEETSKVPQKKSKKKLKNKGRNVKRQSATEESLKNEKLLKENACEPGNYYCNGLNKSNMHIAVRVEEESKKADISEDISKKSLLLGSKKEPVHGIADDEAQRSAKKNGKENNKRKKSRIKEISVDNGKWKAINSTLSTTAECADRLLENSMSVLGFSGIASRDTSAGFSDIYAVNEPITNDGSNSVMNVQDALVRAPSQSNNICEGKEADCHKLDLNSTGCPIVREAIVSHDADSILHGKEATGYYARGSPNPIGGLSYEWPSLGPVYFPSVYSPHLPLATDRLHLDVGHNWHSHLHQSFFTTRHQARNAVLENGWGQILPTGLDVTDDGDNSHWTVDEEADFHAFPGRDYNQFFGGGVMYWNPTDHGATSFSRPPSLSSEDSSWAWHEAELSRAVDEMVGFNYSANGLASPPAAPFCSPFDPVGPTQQPIGFVVPGNVATGNDVTGEDKVSGSLTNGGFVEGLTADSQPYPVLRPLIVPNISKRDSRSEYKLTHDRKSPCLPPTRHETPRIKRPPSPVILCVPQAPRPPPPCPVSDTRKHRGFPGARSGSSSPRNWGMRGWYHDGLHCEESRICADAPEVIWPSWRNKGLGPTKIAQTLPGSLLHDRLIAISQLAVDQEHPDFSLPLQPPNLQTSPSRELSLSVMHNVLHEEIDSFCKKVADVNLIKKPYINWAVKRVARSLQVLWPRSRTTIFGSSATGLALPSSDVDLVVCLPPVRNLEPIKEAGILEGRNGIKETCLQHAARYLGNQEWVKNDSLKTIENTAIPVLMLVAEVPYDLVNARGSSSTEIVSEIEKSDTLNDIESLDHCGLVESGNNLWQMDSHTRDRDKTDVRLVRLDISFKSPAHTGLRTTELVRELTEQFPAVVPLALVLKQFLADRSLDHSYSGGLSSYCLVLLIIRFLQHEHHVGCSTKSLGSLLMDFLYFFGNVFDPRQMRISIQGTGVYVKRERGHSIDPLHIDDPLCPMNNVGRNCFRIHQCIKAFADAYSVLENELLHLPASNEDLNAKILFKFLPKIIPSIDNV